jgi:hypothetical protein
MSGGPSYDTADIVLCSFISPYRAARGMVPRDLAEFQALIGRVIERVPLSTFSFQLLWPSCLAPASL